MTTPPLSLPVIVSGALAVWLTAFMLGRGVTEIDIGWRRIAGGLLLAAFWLAPAAACFYWWSHWVGGVAAVAICGMLASAMLEPAVRRRGVRPAPSTAALIVLPVLLAGYVAWAAPRDLEAYREAKVKAAAPAGGLNVETERRKTMHTAHERERKGAWPAFRLREDPSGVDRVVMDGLVVEIALPRRIVVDPALERASSDRTRWIPIRVRVLNDSFESKALAKADEPTDWRIEIYCPRGPRTLWSSNPLKCVPSVLAPTQVVGQELDWAGVDLDGNLLKPGTYEARVARRVAGRQQTWASAEFRISAVRRRTREGEVPLGPSGVPGLGSR